MHFGKDLVAIVIQSTLVAAQHFIEGQPAGWLPSTEDPFHYNANTGPRGGVEVQSRASTHMGCVLHIVLRGLWHCLVVSKVEKEASFGIHEDSGGVIGAGRIAASLPLPNSL